MNQLDTNAEYGRCNLLSERQAECLTLAGQGLTSKEIARAIGLAPSTVDNHINSAIARLGARNRVEAAHFLLRSASTSPAEHLLITQRENQQQQSVWASIVTPPPLGGLPNTMRLRQRLFHVGQIAMLAMILAASFILTIAGVVYVFAS